MLYDNSPLENDEDRILRILDLEEMRDDLRNDLKEAERQLRAALIAEYQRHHFSKTVDGRLAMALARNNLRYFEEDAS